MSRPPPGNQEQSIPSFRPRGGPGFRPRMPYNESGGGGRPQQQGWNNNFPAPGPRGAPMGYPPPSNFSGGFPRSDFSAMNRGGPRRGFGNNVNLAGGRMPPSMENRGGAPFMASGSGGDYRASSVPNAGPPLRPYQRGGAQAVVTPTAGRGRVAKKPGGARQVDEEDQLIVRPLGAGQEVGRSCILLEFKGKKILLDMGIHPAYNGHASLPYLDHINVEEIELLLITHFHLDHAGALPYFLMKTKFKGRCFMTHATKAIYRWMLADFLRVSQGQEQLFTESDLEQSMEKIETMDFHEEKEIGGVRFWGYTAGHVLGAAMFMIEIAGVRVLYTGDFSKEEDRHLCAAEIPSERCDVVIMESTYGIHVHEDRQTREHRLVSQIANILHRGGKVLIPSFALGRAQEILLILDEHWKSHPELQNFPMYYASALAKKCMSVYETYTGAMNDRIKRISAVHNPFKFEWIQSIRGREDFDEKEPCVVIASPGMMQSGLSRELFELWCSDPKNGCIIAGYVVEGTLGKLILTEPTEITTLAGQKIPRRCTVDYVSFSAHTDFKQTTDFITALKPPQIILVHGEAAEMGRLKMGLNREFENTDYKFQIHTPGNTRSVSLNFRGEKTVKVVGTLAEKRPRDGEEFSGMLLKKSFTYTLADAKDIANVTDLPKTELTHRVSISYNGSLGNVANLMQDICSDVELTSETEAVFLGILRVKKEGPCLIVEWDGSALADMLSDALLGMLVHIQEDEPSDALPKQSWDDVSERRRYFDAVRQLLSEVYGADCITADEEQRTMKLDVKGKSAEIFTDDCKAVTADLGFRSSLYTYLARLYRSMYPVDFWCHTEAGLVI
ncbi:Cleavage and polyadenylation specificity factor subunit 3 [Hypsibius exemplaris]|uniref:Cleavage and polyadenylation specificity factor subunit 3 n=1 Tax=Hypsibius exemplaris TaxID=2072580 RepID=A0A1W0WZW4_HYPEX|nr:Cleavage and polyadenylation specificity factor subunit 3 [Hypsibius exemplaris]